MDEHNSIPEKNFSLHHSFQINSEGTLLARAIETGVLYES